MQSLDKHKLHISFKNDLDSRLKAAIYNVFENFEYFLQFNKYSYDFQDVSIGTSPNSLIYISNTFQNNLIQNQFSHIDWFNNAPYIQENNNIDYIGTCFYMINCLQEFAASEKDSLGRFQYKNSYQAKFSCAQEHLVLHYFQEIAQVIFGEKIPLTPSQYFLSHDIDSLNNGWKSAAKQALLKGNVFKSLHILKDKFQGKDPFQNLEQIMELENQAGVASTFFFLTQKENTSYPNVSNADYDTDDNYVQGIFNKIKASAIHQLGLHKSIGSKSFEEELTQLPLTQLNRFHYLQFSLPDSFDTLAKTNILWDCSLGFSDQIGFRASYGLPFKAMNPITGQTYPFFTLPLLLMDSSLFYYMGAQSQEAMLSASQQFIKSHAQSCVLSILWHNSLFHEKYYVQLLQSINKQGLKSFTFS